MKIMKRGMVMAKDELEILRDNLQNVISAASNAYQAMRDEGHSRQNIVAAINDPVAHMRDTVTMILLSMETQK